MEGTVTQVVMWHIWLNCLQLEVINVNAWLSTHNLWQSLMGFSPKPLILSDRSAICTTRQAKLFLLVNESWQYDLQILRSEIGQQTVPSQCNLWECSNGILSQTTCRIYLWSSLCTLPGEAVCAGKRKCCGTTSHSWDLGWYKHIYTGYAYYYNKLDIIHSRTGWWYIMYLTSHSIIARIYTCFAHRDYLIKDKHTHTEDMHIIITD